MKTYAELCPNLTAYQIWMVKSNLKYIEAEGLETVVNRLRANGYNNIADGVVACHEHRERVSLKGTKTPEEVAERCRNMEIVDLREVQAKLQGVLDGTIPNPAVNEANRRILSRNLGIVTRILETREEEVYRVS